MVERPYKVYRARPSLLDRLRRKEPALSAPGGPRRPRPGVSMHGRRGLTRGRVVRWVLAIVSIWLLFSLLVFLVSAQIQQGKVSDSAENALDPAGYVLTSTNTVLVLGSDARTEKTNDTGGPLSGTSRGRSDSILLMRVGGGASARLSIPRDTAVDIPGSGRDKINAAYAIGGPSLAITTVKQFLGIEINHLIEVNFENFPQLIDALGGVNVKTGCVRAEVNGGDAAGGVSLDLPAGKNHLDGRRALALARTRKNACRPSEDDRDRAARQQEILSAMRRRMFSPVAFVRLPIVSWSAPQAIRSDMSGPSLVGLFAAMATTGSPEPRVLASGEFTTLPNGSSAITVSDEEKREEVRRFLDG